ncbi:MAG: NAD(P)-dependent oxidoreductase [Promethearchaeota archaeon]
MGAKPIVILDPNFRKMEEIFSPTDLTHLQEIVEIIWGKNEPMPLETFKNALPAADIVICGDWRYGDILKTARKLRAIISVSGGFPRELDYSFCFKNNIRVLSVAPSFARQVAEMALGMTLAASREIVIGDRAMRDGNEKWLHAGNKNTFLLYEKPVGFIGFGGIAQELLRLLQPFKVSISVYDPWLSNRFLRNQNVIPTDLATLIKKSKVIYVLATPTLENRHLLSREYLELIQQDAILVLISRAHLVDFDSLTDLVGQGRFKAAIDVFPTEPLEADHPIRQAKYAVLSAHRAGSVKEGLWEIGQMVIDDLEMIVSDLPPQRLKRAEPELIRRTF